MGSEEWNEKKFQDWLKLRDDFRSAKKEKNFGKIIDIGKSIIELASEKSIGIFTPLFEKEIADAYIKLNKKGEALIHYKIALTGYNEDRKKNKKENSWLKEIERLAGKIEKLSS